MFLGTPDDFTLKEVRDMRTHLEQSAPLTMISDWAALFRVTSNAARID